MVIPKVGAGFEVVSLGGLHKRIDANAGVYAVGRADKLPVLAANCERADAVIDLVVGDDAFAVFEIPLQLRLAVFGGILGISDICLGAASVWIRLWSAGQISSLVYQ